MRIMKKLAAAAALSLSLGTAAHAGPAATVTLVTAPGVVYQSVIIVVPATGNDILINGEPFNASGIPQVQGIIRSIQARLAGGGNINAQRTVNPAVIALLSSYF